MDRDAVLAVLKAHEAELRAAGVERLRLFGSAARNEAQAQSDIDLLARFADTADLSILDVIHLENRLSDLLVRKADLIEEGTLPRAVAQAIEPAAILAF